SEQRHICAARAGLLGEGGAHAPRRAVAEEPDAVERLARAAGGYEHAPPGEARRRQELRGARGDPRGLGHAPDAPLAFSRLPFVRADELDAAGTEELDARAGRRVRPHAWVH